MKKTGVFFGSSSGNTESIAEKIAESLDADLHNVANNPSDEIQQYQNLVLGTSTWGVGDLQDDWEGFLPDLEKADLSGKTIALFGLGDAVSYSDSFVDGMGIIYDVIKDKGCTIVGQVAAEGYDFEDSKANQEGKFVGLPLDEDNDSDLTNERLEKWIIEIKSKFEEV
jgi:flavodoxin I